MLAPGLLDIQVHFREPGFEHKETIHTGSKSAAAGGITTVVCQPNTNPVIDSPLIVEYIKSRARETSYINIRLYASISKAMKGAELTEMALLKETGLVVGFTDDGLPVMNAELMRRAFEFSKMLNVPIAQHAEDLNLSHCFNVTAATVTYTRGVAGIPNISESVIVARDVQIAEYTGGHYHVLHVSAKESLDAIRAAKKRGVSVTCEVSPHHFSLTDEAVLGFNTLAKMNPPLRSEEDRQAMIEALKDGTIDAIATDHAPHDVESKSLPLAQASFGIVGVETMLPIALELYHSKKLSLRDVMAKMTYKAADIIRENKGRIKKGAIADLVVVDIDHPWTIEPGSFASLSKNTPFKGRKVKGRAIRTVCKGQTVYTLG